MPALIYAWDVIGIVRQTAPFVPAGPRLLVRDEAKLGWEQIEVGGKPGEQSIVGHRRTGPRSLRGSSLTRRKKRKCS